MRGLFHFALVVLLLLVVAMASAVVTMHFAIHGAEVTTPNFKGLTLPEAGRRAAQLGLTLHVESRLYSADVAPGRVANQSPAAGTVVRRGWRVWLTQSLGPQKRAIPDVVGQDQRIAVIDLRRASLETGAMASLPWAAAPPGTVLAQSPQANASDVAGPAVNLLLAAEMPPQPQDGLVMPDVEGQLFPSAAMMLSRAGLRLAPVKEQAAGIAPLTGASPQPSAPTGTVVGQDPPPGYRVDPTMPITLTVAK